MEENLYLWFLCGCYLLGGLTIGWFGGIWYRNRKRGDKSGTGRWDYKDRHLGGGDGDYFKE